jgi:5-methylcytosine-specific restriction endonuclease McrA
MKKCTECKIKKELSDFTSQKGGKFGLKSRCALCTNKNRRQYYSKNKEKERNSRKNRYKLNRDKELAYNQEYKKNNKGAVNAVAAKRRAKKLQATPKWLTEEQLDRIKQIYINAQDLRWEDEMHVDHIIPLQGKNVSGLHVPWNLRIISAEENLRKGNKYGNS